MVSLYQKIYDDLLSHQNKKAAAADKASHKYVGYRSFGLKSPVIERILKSYRGSIKELSRAEILSLAEQLYRQRIEETSLAGNFILQHRPDFLDARLLPFLDKMAEHFTSWSITDDFCIDVLQPVLQAHPEETLALLKKWSASSNMWKRRSSVVAFVRKVGASGLYTDHALALCRSLIEDKEDLVQKGVGWCLKDVMRGDRKKILPYVTELRRQKAPAVITLYAIRDLKGVERQRVLKVG